jgi:hypothetical protein
MRLSQRSHYFNTDFFCHPERSVRIKKIKRGKTTRKYGAKEEAEGRFRMDAHN